MQLTSSDLSADLYEIVPISQDSLKYKCNGILRVTLRVAGMMISLSIELDIDDTGKTKM